MGSALVRGGGTTGPAVAAKQDGSARGMAYAGPARGVAYAGEVRYTRWADLPAGPKMPAGTVWDVAASTVLRRGTERRQEVTAWALTPTGLLHATAVRPLALNSAGKLAPSGRWAVEMQQRTVRELARMRPAMGPGTDAQGDAMAVVEDVTSPVESLPASVQQPLHGDGTPLQWAVLFGGRREEVRALTVGSHSVTAVLAVRDRNGRKAGPWDLSAWRGELAGDPALGRGGRQELGAA